MTIKILANKLVSASDFIDFNHQELNLLNVHKSIGIYDSCKFQKIIVSNLLQNKHFENVSCRIVYKADVLVRKDKTTL